MTIKYESRATTPQGGLDCAIYLIDDRIETIRRQQVVEHRVNASAVLAGQSRTLHELREALSRVVFEPQG